MELFEYLKLWWESYPVLISVAKYLIWAIGIIVSVQLLRKYLKKKLPNTTTRYKSQKGVEIVGYLILGFLSITYFTGNIEDFTIAIGLFSAGMAFTLQELILSIAGSLYIFIVKVYVPGDRIEINGIKGDVIDIDSIYTTMMEIGEWVSSDNYNGRIVKLSNAFVFKGPIFNYSQDFPFIWDELNIPIHHGSNVQRTKDIINEVAQIHLSNYVNHSKTHWESVVLKYYIEDAVVAPTLAITITDNWIQCNLRYIVDYKKRRITKDLLYRQIQSAILKTKGEVTIASATIEIVETPTFTTFPYGTSAKP